MFFQARLKQISATRRHWLAQRRVSGALAGVTFRWQPGDDFVSDPLENEHQIERLRALTDVQLEVMTQPVLTDPAAFSRVPVQDETPARTDLQQPDAIHRMPADKVSADGEAHQDAEQSVETILPADDLPANKYVPATQPTSQPSPSAPPRMRPPPTQRPLPPPTQRPLPPSAWSNGKKR